MRTDDFDYYLPEELIAQFPLSERDQCKLLYINKQNEEIAHLVFDRIKSLLKPGDRLVYNNTRVIPARLFGRKENGVSIEFLFTEKVDDFTWKAIAKPAKRLKVGTVIHINGCEKSKMLIEKVFHDGGRLVRVVDQSEQLTIEAMLEQYGHLPLPPYINREDNENDRENYQTVFADKKGAIACPTAGLHFTELLINDLKSMGVDISYVTLHVGIGTFRPVKVDDPSNHDIHEEYL